MSRVNVPFTLPHRTAVVLKFNLEGGLDHCTPVTMLRVLYTLLIFGACLPMSRSDPLGTHLTLSHFYFSPDRPLAELLHEAAVSERDADPFKVPYNLQQGAIRYAPMQQMPPTAIVATNTAPIWPTSPVVLATTLLPPPTVETTVTQGNTQAAISHANTVRSGDLVWTRILADIIRRLHKLSRLVIWKSS